ncbi:MAG: pyruvate formate lyase-activating protein, partial [Thermoflexus sp.]
MRILCVDIGTGTQDILLYDSQRELENAYQLVLPSPTMRIARAIRRATRERRAVLLTGVTMGGGPCQWAVEDHLRAGLPVYATPEAARTFNDDLEAVAAMGVRVIREDEAMRLDREVVRLELRDFDWAAIRQAFEAFDVPLRPDGIAVAVFDHGAAPPGVSDRKFRFDLLAQRLAERRDLLAFAYRAEEVPPVFTRMRATVETIRRVFDGPVAAMDTAPAAVLGAILDP